MAASWLTGLLSPTCIAALVPEILLAGCHLALTPAAESPAPIDHFAPSFDRPFTGNVAELGDRYPNSITATSRGPIEGVPGPATGTWKSRDVTPMQATVDMEEIFRDRLIRHSVTREDIPDRIGIGTPLIVLEVFDRTINVYMKARIPLKALRDPENRYSDFETDLIRVWSRTFEASGPGEGRQTAAPLRRGLRLPRMAAATET